MKNNEIYNSILKKRELLLESSSKDIKRYSAAKGTANNIFGEKLSNKNSNNKNNVKGILENAISVTGEVLTNKEIIEKLNVASLAEGSSVQNDVGIIYRSDKLEKPLKGKNSFDIGEYIGSTNNDTISKNLLNNTFNKDSVMSRFSNPGLAIYKIRNKDISIRNSKETEFIPIFTNMIPQIEMSRCSPHLNIVIVDDSEIPDERISLSKFLVGRNQFKNDGFARGLSSVTLQNKNDIVFKTQANISAKRSGRIKPQNVSGMGIFLSTQALVNSDINRFQMGTNRVVDPFRPFMSIESFSVQDYLAGYKFLSSVKGSLNLKLFDRSRLPEISKLIGIKYLSSVSLIIEYGWNHPEGGIISNNPFGQFLNSQKRRELFKITSNRMSINDDGTVSITLELISISTNTKAITSLNSKFMKVEELNEYLDLLKKKIKNRNDRHSYKTHLDLNKIDNATLGKKANDLISLEALYNYSTDKSGKNISWFEKFEELLYNSIDKKFNLNSISLFLEKTGEILYDPDSGKTNIDKDESDSGEKSENEEDKQEVIKSSSIEYIKNMANFAQSNDIEITQQNKVVENPDTETEIGASLVVKRLNTIYSSDATSEFSFAANETDSLKIGDNEEKIYKYMTLGKLLTGLYFIPMHNSKEYDEMQVYFHTANNYAAAFHNVSLGDVFIDTKRFLKSVRTILEKTGNGTLDIETIFQIVREILKNPDPYEIGYGITDIGSQLGGYIDPNIRDEKRKELIQDRNSKLIKIYKTADNSVDVKTLDFIPINLQIRTDVKVKLIDGMPRKIIKVHVYDKAQERYTESKMLLEGVNNSDVNLFLNTIKAKNNISLGFKKFTNFFTKKSNKREIQTVAKEIAEDSFTFNALQSYVHINIDKIIKAEVPTIEFGSNSAIIENISITNDSGGLANELNLYRYVNSTANPQDNNQQQNIEQLFINPSKISIQMLGCPFISIGQEFYVTAGTNTTLDTIYHVESLSHNITEGSFKTTVTLQAAGGSAYKPSNITKNIAAITSEVNRQSTFIS